MPAKFSGKTPGEKLLALYTLLLFQDEKAPFSLGRLAQLLDCSKQTVLRLLDQLEASRFGKLEEPIRKGREHYYRLQPQPRQTLDIGPKEAAQLALCRSTLMRLLPKAALPAGETESPSPAVHVVYKGYIDYERFTGQYATLLRAVEERRVCRITYRRSPFREPRAFFFAPMRLLSYRESLAAIGWEVTERGPARRLYENHLLLYLQRCESVSLTARGSKGLPEPEGGNAFGLLAEDDPFALGVLFEEDTAGYVCDRQWAADQRLELTPDRRIRLEMTARNPAETISWVLGFGDRATVLYPDWLKEEVRRRALAVAEKYASPT